MIVSTPLKKYQVPYKVKSKIRGVSQVFCCHFRCPKISRIDVREPGYLDTTVTTKNYMEHQREHKISLDNYD